jgi:putative ABC transport system substrate-binding protein
MTRRPIGLLVTLALGLLVAPLAAEGPPAGRLPRIGFLGNSTAALEANLVGPFRDGLRDRGYGEGQTIVLEYRWAEGKYERFPELISDLLRLNVEMIVTAGTSASLAVKKATTSLPLVMIAVGDLVGTGLITSLARPGGSVTGVTSMAADLEGKRLELLRKVVPTLAHLAVLWNPASPFQVVAEQEVQAPAQALRINVLAVGVQAEEQFDQAFATIRRERPEALNVLADRLFLHTRGRLASPPTRACRGCMRTASSLRPGD